MTIIIPYREDLLKGLELRYALRAIQKYLTGFTNVIIIGKPPEWYKGESVFMLDEPGRKQYSIYRKLLLSCELTNCTDDFIMFNDDHFLLQPLDVSELKYWYSGWLTQELWKDMGGRYREAIMNTLQRCPLVINFDVHTPIIYNSEVFKKLFSDRKDEICIKSTYCHNINAEPTHITDVKINNFMPYDMIKNKIQGQLFFSTGSSGIKAPMIQILNELYPEQSIWEK